MRQFAGMFVPGGVLLLAAWALQHEAIVRDMAAPSGVYFCLSALVVPVLLSWYHDQSRLLAISIALALTVFGWVRLPAEADIARLAMFFFVPLIILLMQVFSEQRVLTRIGVVRVGLVGAAALTVLWASVSNEGWFNGLFSWGGGRSSWTWLPWTIQIAFLAALIVVA